MMMVLNNGISIHMIIRSIMQWILHSSGLLRLGSHLHGDCSLYGTLSI